MQWVEQRLDEDDADQELDSHWEHEEHHSLPQVETRLEGQHRSDGSRRTGLRVQERRAGLRGGHHDTSQQSA
jgi:hypothetical protein